MFTAVILWAVRPTIVRSVAVIVVALLFAATRDTQIWVVALVAVAFGTYALWRGLRVDVASARPALIVTTGLVMVVVCTATSSMVSHRDVRNVQNALAVRVFPYPNRIGWFADHGMPQAARLTALAQRDDRRRRAHARRRDRPRRSRRSNRSRTGCAPMPHAPTWRGWPCIRARC